MPANDDKYAVTTWAQENEDLECPSGQLCLVRRVDPMQLLTDGTLHKTDLVTMLIDEQHVGKKSKGGKRAAELAAQKKSDSALREALADPEKMKNLVRTVNAVVLATVIKPELLPEPENETEKISGKTYVSSVRWEDRMFIMQFALAGTRDVARFRRELGESVERLADGESVEEDA